MDSDYPSLGRSYQADILVARGGFKKNREILHGVGVAQVLFDLLVIGMIGKLSRYRRAATFETREVYIIVLAFVDRIGRAVVPAGYGIDIWGVFRRRLFRRNGNRYG